MLPLWPWQERGTVDTIALLEGGAKAIVRALFTGGGKTREAIEVCRWAVDQEKDVLFYVNQCHLTHQAGAAFAKAGMEPGFVARGFQGPLSNVRVASLQTVMRRHKNSPPKADLVIVDEVHNHGFDHVLDHYKAEGTPILGYTATPIDLWDGFEHMVSHGTKAEGRKYGALVPCRVVAPEEIDLSDFKVNSKGEFSAKDADARIADMTDGIIGGVIDAWLLNNPKQTPTLCWCPGKASSRGMAAAFMLAGIKAEHIDGDMDWMTRKAILARFKSGVTKVLCSCNVLREGVDLPHASYGVLLQPCGLLKTFLQIVGRILRAGGEDIVVLQDHVGAVHRHGLPDMDHPWRLGLTSRFLLNDRKADLTSDKCRVCEAPLEPKQEKCHVCYGVRVAHPISCRECRTVRGGGSTCPKCGLKCEVDVRFIRTKAGKLKEVKGDYMPRKDPVREAKRAWSQCGFMCAAKGFTVGRMIRIFLEKTGCPEVPDFVRPRLDDRRAWDRVGVGSIRELTSVAVAEAWPFFVTGKAKNWVEV